MTPQARKMQDGMNSLENTDKETLSAISKQLRKSFKTISKLYREAIYDNKILFGRIFIASLTSELRLKIIANYLNVSLYSLQISPNKEEIERMTFFMMTCECLADLYEIIGVSFGLNVKEFILSWHMMNETEELKDIFLCSNPDPEMLNEKTRNYYIKAKEAKDAEEAFAEAQRKKNASSKN